MLPRVASSLWFVEPGRLAPGAQPFDALWYADADGAASDAIAARNRAVGERLAASLPDLAPDADAQDGVEEVLEPGLSAPAMIRRYERRRAWQASWQGGTLRLSLYDGVALLELDLPAAGPDAAALDALVRDIAGATGFAPWWQGETLVADAAAAALFGQLAPRVRVATRQASREHLLARFGTASAALLTLAALALTGLLLRESLILGTPLAQADPARPASFITQGLAPPSIGLGLLPRYALLGRVEGVAEPVLLPVDRDTALRAGPGGRLTVLPTGNAAVPFVPRSMALQNAAVPVGPFGFALPWLVVGCAVPLVWWLAVGRPLRRAARQGWPAEARAAMTRRLLWAISATVVVGVLVGRGG